MSQDALVELDPEEWDARLAELGGGDVYLESGYVSAACVLEAGEPVFLHLAARGGDVALAAIVRAAPAAGLADVTTPYGYGGPVAIGSDPPVARFWELYEEWCRSRSVVASFFRFHPLYANQRYAGPNVRCELLGPTVSWPLPSDVDLAAGLHPTHRNKVRKAERAGAEAVVCEAPGNLDDFAALYEETMSRLEAHRYYRFSSAYWKLLCAGLGDRLVVIEARIGGELVASALCLAGPRWLHYHLSATSELGRRIGAANLVLLGAARWGQDRGLEQFHLGGGMGGQEDSLLAFKEHFAPGSRQEMFVGKAVHDIERYLELSGASSLSFDGYFPAYRQGAGSPSAGSG